MPLLSTDSPENVATPLTAVTVVVPDNVPPPGLAPRATVTLPVKVGSVFPEPSWAVTCTAGVIDVPAAVLLGCTENTKCAPMPAVILNVALGLPVSPVAAAVSVYPVPTLSTDSPENVATPLAAATVVVPESVPLPGFAPSATVTVPVNPVAVFPCASCAVTWTAGVIAAPAVVLLGCTLNTSWLAVPAVMLKPPLVADVTPVAAALSVKPVPTLLMLRFANVATPFTAATLVVPESVPPPGFGLSATVTVPVNPVAVFPCASCAVTCTAGVIAVPAVVLLGWTLNTSWLTVPDVTLNAALVAGLSPLAAPVSV